MSDLPKHPARYDERVMLACPKCNVESVISWGELETGTQHKCPMCGYEWQIGDGPERADSATNGSGAQ